MFSHPLFAHIVCHAERQMQWRHTRAHRHSFPYDTAENGTIILAYAPECDLVTLHTPPSGARRAAFLALVGAFSGAAAPYAEILTLAELSDFLDFLDDTTEHEQDRKAICKDASSLTHEIWNATLPGRLTPQQAHVSDLIHQLNTLCAPLHAQTNNALTSMDLDFGSYGRPSVVVSPSEPHVKDFQEVVQEYIQFNGQFGEPDRPLMVFDLKDAGDNRLFQYWKRRFHRAHQLIRLITEGLRAC